MPTMLDNLSETINEISVEKNSELIYLNAKEHVRKLIK